MSAFSKTISKIKPRYLGSNYPVWLTSQSTSFQIRTQSSILQHTKTSKTHPDEKETKPLTRKEKLKLAVKEYGSTVIIFHVTISLVSLGACYTLVSSGIDMTEVFKLLHMDGFSNQMVTKSGTFVVAYAIHKVFAPVRIGITLSATPLIVRYLRMKGWIRKH